MGHTGWVNAVAFSPDGQTIISGSEDETIRLWSLAEQKEIGRLMGHADAINSVVFSPDGKTIVSSSGDPFGKSKDSTVRLWDVANLKEIGRLTDYGNAFNSVIFTPDGQTIVSGGQNGSVQFWPTLPHLLELSDQLIQRDPPIFVGAERVKYGLDGPNATHQH